MRKRKTIQQIFVVEALQELTGHPTAQEIHSKIYQKYDGISIATVYSNLKNLIQSGDVRVLSFIGRADRYEMNQKEHYHIRCQNCGNFCDLPAEGMNAFDSQVTDACGYIIKSHEIMFHGICPECQKSKDPNKEVKGD